MGNQRTSPLPRSHDNREDSLPGASRDRQEWRGNTKQSSSGPIWLGLPPRRRPRQTEVRDWWCRVFRTYKFCEYSGQMAKESIVITTQISSGNSTTGTISSKETRLRFGTRKAPLVVSSAAKAYCKTSNFDARFTDPTSPEYKGANYAQSWVVIDPTLVTSKTVDGVTQTLNGSVVRTNTYGGNVGAKADILNEAYLAAIPDEKGQKKMLKGYTEVPLSEVPYITVAETPADESTKQDETPAAQLEVQESPAAAE